MVGPCDVVDRQKRLAGQGRGGDSCELRDVPVQVGLVGVAAVRRDPGCVLSRDQAVGGMVEADQRRGALTTAALANVFFFLYEPQRTLGELHRVLASGGRLAIHTEAPGLPAWLAPITRRMRLYDDAQLVQLLAAAGFSDATVSRTAGGRGQLATAHRA